MDCWQECNFPSSKSPIGFHTLQGFSRYTREIGRRSLGMELLTSLQIQAYLRLWALPKVTLFLNPHPLGWDIAIQQNMTVFLWQEALPSWHVWLMGPPSHQHTMLDGWCVDRKTVFGCIPVPSQSGWSSTNTGGTFTFLREAPKGNAATAISLPRRIIHKRQTVVEDTILPSWVRPLSGHNTC